MIHAVWNILLELSPWLLLGAVVAGVLHVIVPAGWLRKHLSGRGGVLKAVLFGIPLPLCSCGVIPVGLGLKKDGASNGAVVGFLISTPQTGVDSILVSASMLGWPFAVFKVAAALVTGLIGGLFADTVTTEVTAAPESSRDPSGTTSSAWRRFLDHAWMLIHSIWFWLTIGVLVSAMISWLVPENSLAGRPGMTGISAMLLTLLISVPLYVCATSSVPIAAALVVSGLPAGAALVFLMAGPATNVATLGAVYRTLGPKSLAVYLATIVVGSIAAGLAFESVVDTGAVISAMHDHSTGWLRIACAVLLLGLLLVAAAQDIRRWLRRNEMTRNASSQSVQTLHVDGMTCNGCAARLERVLQSADGVRRASVSFDARQAVVEGDASRQALCESIERAGFEVRDASEEAAAKN
ncbi:MAG: permease [Planctomycetaceae bacterium]